MYGTPTVAYFAEQLHLSANYFGDLIKKETGKSAQEYVQQKIMDTAKDMLASPGKSVSEIAYALGYQYPQCFSRGIQKKWWVARRMNTAWAGRAGASWHADRKQ